MGVTLYYQIKAYAEALEEQQQQLAGRLQVYPFMGILGYSWIISIPLFFFYGIRGTEFSNEVSKYTRAKKFTMVRDVSARSYPEQWATHTAARPCLIIIFRC